MFAIWLQSLIVLIVIFVKTSLASLFVGFISLCLTHTHTHTKLSPYFYPYNSFFHSEVPVPADLVS